MKYPHIYESELGTVIDLSQVEMINLDTEKRSTRKKYVTKGAIGPEAPDVEMVPIIEIFFKSGTQITFDKVDFPYLFEKFREFLRIRIIGSDFEV